jgi:hypothetical protein
MCQMLYLPRPPVRAFPREGEPPGEPGQEGLSRSFALPKRISRDRSKYSLNLVSAPGLRETFASRDHLSRTDLRLQE